MGLTQPVNAPERFRAALPAIPKVRQSPMTLPQSIFLDTSVFAGQQYNFGSIALSTFVEVAKEKGLSLVLPAPTENEVKRQLTSRSDEALKALEEARRKAPFLKKWKHWPEKPTSDHPEWEVGRIAAQEWKDFLSQVSVVRLGYEGIKLEKIMQWYDTVRAPFREGKKRKEFPDAFAVESLAIYAAKKQIVVAVVSEDPDFKFACEHYGSLLYFSSLPKLTESLLSQEFNFEPIRNSILEKTELLLDAIWDQIGAIGFYSDDSEIELKNSEVEEIDLGEFRIVGIGDSECIVVFDARLEAKHTLTSTMLEGEYADEPYRETVSLRQSAPISGTLKIQIASSDRHVMSVSFIELDQDEVRVEASDHHWYRSY